MKVLNTLFAVVAMFLVVSCGNSAQDKAQGEVDQETSSQSIIDEANESLEAENDANADADANQDEAETPADSTNQDSTEQSQAAPSTDEDATTEDHSEEDHSDAGGH